GRVRVARYLAQRVPEHLRHPHAGESTGARAAGPANGAAARTIEGMTRAPLPRDLPERPVRPRDELGRPLSAEATSRLDSPDLDGLTLDACIEAGIRCFDAGNYFGAHEAWWTCWARTRDTDEERFFRGLAQVSAGGTHWARGNARGAAALFTRAI